LSTDNLLCREIAVVNRNSVGNSLAASDGEQQLSAPSRIKNKIMKRMCIGVNIVQKIMERKLNFFGHIRRMPDDRLIKQVVFGIMDDKNKRGRPKRKWTDDL